MPAGPHAAAASAILDSGRLAALASTGLLDSEPEPEFDRLTALTARVAGAPVSLVALIDADRSYFKSAYGVPEMPSGRTVPLSHSLCQHVVGTGATLVIDDARTHPLVRDNGGVTDLGVGAYLGVPVRSPSGHVLGSLCAIDLEARSWTSADQQSLVSLAASVEGEIALRAELADRERAEALARDEADALAAVIGVNARLASELDPDRLVQAVVDAGVAMTQATVGAFFYRPADEAGQAFLFAATGLSPSALDAFAVLQRSPESAATLASTVRSGDVASDPALAWVLTLLDGAVDLRSLISVPVADASGALIGALLFGHLAVDAFDARAERGALAIADQAAIALQNARLHRALDQSERRHRAVLAGLSDVVFQTDPAGLYTYLNQAWEDRTGHRVADALRRPLFDFAAGDAGDIAAAFAEAVAGATPASPLMRALTAAVECADGTVRHFEARGRMSFDETGALLGSLGTLTDVTDTVRYHAEREARQAAEAAREEAERMARLQSAFLANMSHEIRTPLTAILGNAEILADEVPADVRDLAVSIQTGGRRLMETLTSVLDLAQIDAGQMTPRPQAVCAREHLLDAARGVAALAEQKGLTLYADLGDLPTVSIDPDLLDRALANLLGNAVKFTVEGSVTLRARHDDDRLRVEVEDTGIGIARDAQGHLFDPFHQASDGHARTHEGNGLGLAITRGVAALLGGAVAVESAPGEGARFTLDVRAPVAST